MGLQSFSQPGTTKASTSKQITCLEVEAFVVPG
jgi:hypothetical protein